MRVNAVTDGIRRASKRLSSAVRNSETPAVASTPACACDGQLDFARRSSNAPTTSGYSVLRRPTGHSFMVSRRSVRGVVTASSNDVNATVPADPEASCFKIRGGSDVSFPKIAGGIARRLCEEPGLRTVLEAMGNQSISNAIKAIVLANAFVAQKHADAASSPKPLLHMPPQRLGFVPSFGKSGDQEWLRLTIVPLQPLLRPDSLGPDAGVEDGRVTTLKIGAKTDRRRLSDAVVASWMKYCASGPDVVLAAMGPSSVSLAVKASTFALKELTRKPKSDQRPRKPFLCYPVMVEVQETDRLKEPQMITQLKLEGLPVATAG
eukprot:TRINITY_DN62912_c0_g1_i1.p1 TRINITY_DN62912_c0_g1~~TRINITY_DN62912_c0_g1_i1.p1  ORF type:complete len:321 (+),score=32.60 TRINITY_DN62912_c0_g1_i1:159-1121(+)